MKSKKLHLSRLYLNRNLDLNSNNNNLTNSNDDGRIAYCLVWPEIIMKIYNNIYNDLTSIENLVIAWRRARENKTRHEEIFEFEKDLRRNLFLLHNELKNKTYKPRHLVNFILRDPKTRKISKSKFRDRVVHHALINLVSTIFQSTFIYDSCANQIGKGTLFAIMRLDKFGKKVTKNNTIGAFCLKADIKHYFQTIDHEILINILNEKIKDENVIWLIKVILENGSSGKDIGMPLGNYTSQFLANVYLNPLDYFVKHKLKAKYYIRYVDDFVILHESKGQLEIWKEQINVFLREKLKLSLHPQKSRIISLSRGVDFVGFRNFKYYKLLRKRNIIAMRRKINLFAKGLIGFRELFDSHQGWQAYAKWGNTFKLRKVIKKEIIDAIWEKF